MTTHITLIKTIALGALTAALALALASCGQDEATGKTESPDALPQTEATSHPEAGSDEAVSEPAPEAEPAGTDDGIRPEFKEAIDSYVAFFQEYYDFMVAYAENPTDLELIGKLADMMEKSTTMSQEFEQLDQSEMSTEELAYYLDALNQIQQLLLDASSKMQ